MSQELIEQHSAWQSFLFRMKVSAFTGKRLLVNLFNRTSKHTTGYALHDAPIIAESRTELWNSNDTAQNWVLTAGKIENLRIAVRRINALEIPAHAVFSFWKHIGNPNIGKGYVTGREIREGCLIPTRAGGLCQLSNALYDAALKAHFTIVERHKHSKVVRGSLAEQDRDATVKWNYVDLRFRSDFTFRIDAFLTDTELVIRFRSEQKAAANHSAEAVTQVISPVNDCYACGNTGCFKHPTGKLLPDRSGITVCLVDEAWPEYISYLRQHLPEGAHIISSVHNSRWLRSTRYNWAIRRPDLQHKHSNRAALKRSFQLRIAAKRGKNPFAAALKADRRLARKLADLIPVTGTHLIVAQNLLPELWASGSLGGRTFDVLMTRLPFATLHHQLDAFYHMYPESPTLNDFRAPKPLVDTENDALAAARNIITPHRGIARLFDNKVLLLDWELPELRTSAAKGTGILFPASAVGRKGAYAIKTLAETLDLELTVLGNATEYPGFWGNLVVQPFTGLDTIGLVVFPAVVEHQPRILLKAVARGIPVITTAAAGLPEIDGVTVVPEGNAQALEAAVKGVLATFNQPSNSQ